MARKSGEERQYSKWPRKSLDSFYFPLVMFEFSVMCYLYVIDNEFVESYALFLLHVRLFGAIKKICQT